MLLYNANAGNTKRVRVYLAEKGLSIPTKELTIGKDTRTDEFRKLNSLGELPVLETDDGATLTESNAICRYLEALYPDPPLMGVTPFEIGFIEMWCQRMHLQLFMTYGNFVRHSIASFAEIEAQVPEFAETQKASLPSKWAWFDKEMSDGRPFVAGDKFSMADVHGITILRLADMLFPIPDICAHANRWAGRLRERSSFEA